MNQHLAEAAVTDLAARLGPGAVVTAGAAYEQTCRIWNGAVTSRPAVVVRARTQDDVQAAVRATRCHGLPLSVRAGGHDWAGRSLRDGGLVIDLSGMTQVTVNPEEGTATVSGGATAAGVIAAAAPHGLAAVTGTVGTVGMTALTLGGGYGLLSGRFGLAADNLLGASLVLADGRAVSVDDDHGARAVLGHPRRRRQLRRGHLDADPARCRRPGARGHHRLPARPGRQRPRATDVIIAAAPDELTVQAVFLTGPDGTPGLFLVPAWSGDPTRRPHAGHRQRLATPVLTQVGPMTYRDLLHLNDAQGVTGRHVTARRPRLPHYSPGVTGALDEAPGPSARRVGRVIQDFHGAAARVPVESTAFGIRRRHRMTEIVGWWEPGDAAPHQAWADNTFQALAPDTLPGGYPNMLSPAAHAQIARAYGPNTARLLAAKARFDPDGIFSAIPLPAAATSADGR